MLARASLLLALVLRAGAGAGGSRYGFYRSMGATGAAGAAGAGARRVFGGSRAERGGWGAACALLDRYWAPRCSGAALAPRWALTAAHCVSPRLAYVRYNAPRHDLQPVHLLYRHPEYKVVQEDEGRGPDVTLLHHDVGLVRTRGDMLLARRPKPAPLASLSLYDAMDIRDEEVEVLGFGRTERSARGEELYSARLRLVACERGAWFHCVCGAGAGPGGAGVCAGDSGGPVLYRGALVGVSSMGPLECAAAREGGADGAGGAASAGREGLGTSVVTALARYAALINGTLTATDARMMHLSRAASCRAPLPHLLLLLLPLLLSDR